MYNFSLYPYRILLFVLLGGFMISCKKWVLIDAPTDSLITSQIYSAEPQAESALVGIYNSLVHGPKLSVLTTPSTAYQRAFGGGLSTLAGGYSSGELLNPFVTETLHANNLRYASDYWSSAYNVIYLANAVIEGLENSTSELVRDSVKRQYTAEAKLLRGFSYLYLVNYFGDVPLALTIDFNRTKSMARTPQTEVYQQILQDLEEAYNTLSVDYAAGQGKRVRVNKWVATALLARTHLYLGQYDQAAAYATEVINQTTLFQLEPLSRVFLTDSREAIFQLMQTNEDNQLKNATSEGNRFLPKPMYTGEATVILAEELLHAFDPGDARSASWIDSTLQTLVGPESKAWYPSKYKVGRANAVLGAPPNEYYMVIRLAEMYLIRSEARAHGADGGTSRAVDDLNVIRYRADLPALPLTLSAAEVQEAVWQERQVELFAEWGHRWLDLKRSGMAVEVLSALPQNQPWEGDWQLLYPIPQSEIEVNHNLIQNPGYDQIQ